MLLIIAESHSLFLEIDDMTFDNLLSKLDIKDLLSLQDYLGELDDRKKTELFDQVENFETEPSEIIEEEDEIVEPGYVWPEGQEQPLFVDEGKNESRSISLQLASDPEAYTLRFQGNLRQMFSQ